MTIIMNREEYEVSQAIERQRAFLEAVQPIKGWHQMTKVEIKSVSGSILYTGEHESVAQALEWAASRARGAGL